jgi:hypothetical protein
MKTCKICLNEFEPSKPLQVTCSYKCALDYARGKMAKKVKKENKEIKERIKTKSQHLKELQIIFNRFIRLRDKGKNCISCDAKIKGNGHASHFFSVGSNPALRFNENNCFVSCEYCNTYLHGNLVEYSLRLPDRIGQDNYDKLFSMRGIKKQYSIPEIEELKRIYKQKIKDIL